MEISQNGLCPKWKFAKRNKNNLQIQSQFYGYAIGVLMDFSAS